MKCVIFESNPIAKPGRAIISVSLQREKLKRTSCEQGIHALHMSSHPSVELHIEGFKYFSGQGAYLYVAESEVPKGRSNPSVVGFLGSLLLGPS